MARTLGAKDKQKRKRPCGVPYSTRTHSLFSSSKVRELEGTIIVGMEYPQQSIFDKPLACETHPIELVCGSLRQFLMEKNRRYGNSALRPVKVFSKLSATDGILQRIDDKVSRIQNSTELRKNDVVDLLGYLVLLCIDKGWTNFNDQID